MRELNGAHMSEGTMYVDDFGPKSDGEVLQAYRETVRLGSGVGKLSHMKRREINNSCTCRKTRV
jgi:hypothetical protein